MNPLALVGQLKTTFVPCFTDADARHNGLIFARAYVHYSIHNARQSALVVVNVLPLASSAKLLLPASMAAAS